ncbi:MAG TPA: ABC transporter permease, partial [Burkholderiaceae bacterium]|nr:ABC transporter permease [Burkholderiaceae bacterium]
MNTALARDAQQSVSSRPAKRRTARLSKLWLPLAWLAIVGLAALTADWLPIPPPNEMDFSATEQGPGRVHLLGTDLDGRDLLSRLAHGARVSLIVSLVGPAIGLLGGTLFGLLS